ncbi:MAG TPA: hypothetical protein VL899_06755 [Alphaproteobacteria bacterium]|jgi:hypothetical protein|nr:hypothetical protein [Alphaproteobacteria bacterium]
MTTRDRRHDVTPADTWARHETKAGLLAASEARLEFILGHPGFSDWLKNAIRTALSREPLAVLNDLELLDQALRPRCEIQLGVSPGPPNRP